MQNPFVMSSHSLSFGNDHGYSGYGGGAGGSDGGLSFGSADGTITSTTGTYNTGSGVDAWVVPGDTGRKSTAPGSAAFGSNPWS
ncbi:hypothetical protein AN958_00203 [Leucoagaricus sp. SymC.cos]|nr:hypothetical protein AN958_00203 [Leucoagaricus sp. SymC.cos]